MSKTVQTTDERKRLAAVKRDHDLHVLILMHHEGLSKAQATVRAYDEGVAGLTARIAGLNAPEKKAP